MSPNEHAKLINELVATAIWLRQQPNGATVMPHILVEDIDRLLAYEEANLLHKDLRG